MWESSSNVSKQNDDRIENWENEKKKYIQSKNQM